MNPREPMFIHYVHDMERACTFYQSLFSIAPAMKSSGWTVFEVASIQLALHILHGEADENPLPHAGMNLMIDNLEEAHETITSAGGRVLLIREPDDFVPVRVATCVDTEGNGFELRQLP